MSYNMACYACDNKFAITTKCDYEDVTINDNKKIYVICNFFMLKL